MAIQLLYALVMLVPISDGQMYFMRDMEGPYPTKVLCEARLREMEQQIYVIKGPYFGVVSGCNTLSDWFDVFGTDLWKKDGQEI